MRLDRQAARSAAAWIIACSFVAALWFPLLDKHAAFPRQELAAGLLTEAGDAFVSKFPFRGPARAQYNKLRYALFGALPPQLLEGRDGWVFYRGEEVNDGEVLTDFMGEVQPSASTVAAWCDTLARRRLWLAAHGAASVVAVAPNKETVYADMLPSHFARKRGRTRLDALTSACGDEVVDLRAPLSGARREHPVYYRGGTHWTSQGAYVAYAAILAAVARSGRPMTPIPRSAFVRRPEPNVDSWLPPEYPRGAENDDGLDPIRSYPACHVGEKGCEPLLIPGWGFVPRAYWDAGRGRLVTEQERSDLPTAVVFHDSFAALWLAPLLAQHFRRVVFAWEEFDRDLVEAEHPDVVISETVERYMPGLVR